LVFALFHRLADFKRVSLRYGSRSPKDIVFKYLLPDWAKKIEVIQTVDVGDEIWKGKVGLVTTVLDELDFNLAMSVAIVCGPPIMMKFVTLKLLEKGFSPGQIYLSMEKNMSCGLGKCGHCRIGPYYVCQDGPVFTYKQLENLTEVWD
jgi:NAD(P)H-flavin reductase